MTGHNDDLMKVVFSVSYRRMIGCGSLPRWRFGLDILPTVSLDADSKCNDLSLPRHNVTSSWKDEEKG